MSTTPASPRTSLSLALAASIAIATFALGCGTNASTSASTTTSTNPYVVAYKSVPWGNTITATYPGACTITLVTTGKPNYTPAPYYLGPASGNQPIVAYTAQTNTPLALISYAANVAPGLKGVTININICPAKAATTTATGLGAIGFLISGTAMFNPFEMNGVTPAVADNGTYTFTDTSGTSQTASFLDACATHSNGSTWHAHGNPPCVTSQVDTATGPSHIIGVALDGFPIYGGRDINGAIITLSQLDACNGITSPTPEFPSGAYHYVLPLGVTSKYASINCYSGTVSTGAIAAARTLACNMKTMTARMDLPNPQPAKVNNHQPAKIKMARMTMPDGTTMTMGSM